MLGETSAAEPDVPFTAEDADGFDSLFGRDVPTMKAATASAKQAAWMATGGTFFMVIRDG
jgi:hypothetical protein